MPSFDSNSSQMPTFLGLKGPPVRSARAATVVNGFITQNELASALTYLENRTRIDTKQLKTMHLMLKRRPRQASFSRDFKDDPSQDVQVVEAKKPRSRPIIFAFAGRGQKLGSHLNLINCWFAQLDASVVYLRDFDDLFYLNGIRSFGSYDKTLVGLQKIADDLGASSTHCLGNSGGGFGALNFGLDLKAKTVLCLAGPTRIDKSLETVLASWETKVQTFTGPHPGRLDPVSRYLQLTNPPRVRTIYGELNERDRAESEHLSSVKNAELISIEGYSLHSIVAALVQRGKLSANLRWLVESNPSKRLFLRIRNRIAHWRNRRVE